MYRPHLCTEVIQGLEGLKVLPEDEVNRFHQQIF